MAIDITDNTDDQLDVSAEATGTNPYADILGQYKGKTAPQLSVADFAPTSAGDPNYAGTIPAQAFSTYFPGEQNNIYKGSYSGSMIGSNPIYAPGQLMPYGLIDARQNALKQAADKKAAEQEAFAYRISNLRSPETQHKAVQPEITNMFYKGLQEDISSAQKKYGNDWAKNLWADPKFHQKIQTVKDVAGYEDVAVKHVAELEHGSETGEFAITPYIQDTIDNFKKGRYGLMSMSSDPDMQEKAKEIFKVQPMLDAVKTSARVAKAIEPDITEGYADISHQGLYDILTTTKTTKPSDKRIRDAVELSYKQMYGGREGAVPYDEYAKMVAANIGKKTETQTQTASTKDGNGLGFQMSEKDLKDGETEIVGTLGGGKKGSFGIQDYYPLPAGVKPFEMASTTKLMDVEGNNVGTGQMIGNKKVSPSGVGNIYKIYKPGEDPNNGKAIKEGQVDSFKNMGYKVQVTPVAILSILDQDEKGKDFVSGTVTAEIDDVSNGVEQRGKDGKYSGGVNTDILKKRASERQAEIDKPKNKKYTADQEAIIKKNLEINPKYSREEIINALGY